MQRITHTSYRRSLLIAWKLLRQVLGWLFILLGLLGLVLPVLQGVLFLVIGVALVGRRNWLIRRSMVIFKRFLRRWAAARAPLVAGAGRVALRAQWRCSRESRRLHRRFAEWQQRRKGLRDNELSGDVPDAAYKHMSHRA